MMLRDVDLAKAVRNYEICNNSAIEIYCSLKTEYEVLSQQYGQHGNILGLLFHDLMVHLTCILIQRESFGDYGEGGMFPYVNKNYSFSPYKISSDQVSRHQLTTRISRSLRQFGVIPVSVGEAIPFGHCESSFKQKLFSALTEYKQLEKMYLPGCDDQISFLLETVKSICKNFSIPNIDVVLGNWRNYALSHVTSRQKIVGNKWLIVGTRVDLQNRKLSLEYLQQEKEVIGITHGEIGNTVFDEPLFGYAELGLCSTLVDYGEKRIRGNFNQSLNRVDNVCARSSRTVREVYKSSDCIRNTNGPNTRFLYIPTAYVENYQYAPYRALEDDAYRRWQSYIISEGKSLTLKSHPKSIAPVFDVNREERWLENCINDYDVLILDYYSTAATLALVTDKPVIFFDIGLRRLCPEFKDIVRARCYYKEIDFMFDVNSQVRETFSEFSKCEQVWSNKDLPQYAITSDHSDYLLTVLRKMI